MINDIAISTRNLSFEYSAGKKILDNISIDIPDNAIVTVLGKNGAGKTTLLDCILGLNKNYTGNIFVFNKDIKDYTRKELASLIGLVPQINQVNFDYTVEDFVLMGCSPTVSYFSTPGKKEYATAYNAMKLLGIEQLRNRLINNLSGGERQLAYIARTVAQQPKIIVLDEPTSALDFGNSIKVIDLIEKLKCEGYTVIFTCHNPDYPLKMKELTLALLPNHSIIFGKTKEVLCDKTLSEIYGVEIKRVYLNSENQYFCVKK